jgi:hypothetical protein
MAAASRPGLTRTLHQITGGTSTDSCSVCLQELGARCECEHQCTCGGSRKWVCARCSCVVHLACMATACGDGLAPCGKQIRRKIDGATQQREPIRCPICRSTFESLREEIMELQSVPYGVRCNICATASRIDHGQLAHRCGNFDNHCLAWWCTDCQAQRTGTRNGAQCPGCRDTIHDCILRRSRAKR